MLKCPIKNTQPLVKSVAVDFAYRIIKQNCPSIQPYIIKCYETLSPNRSVFKIDRVSAANVKKKTGCSIDDRLLIKIQKQFFISNMPTYLCNHCAMTATVKIYYKWEASRNCISKYQFTGATWKFRTSHSCSNNSVKIGNGLRIVCLLSAVPHKRHSACQKRVKFETEKSQVEEFPLLAR